MTLPKTPSAAQFLLGVFALHYEPVRPNELKRLWLAADKLCGRRWSDTSLEEVVGQLTQEGKIFYAPDGLRCHQELAEDVCCAHLSAGTFAQCEATLQNARLHPGRSSYQSTWDYRHFRIAIFHGDKERAEAVADVLRNAWGKETYDAYERLAGNLHSHDSYLALDPEIAQRLALLNLDRQLQGLNAPSGGEAWLESRAPSVYVEFALALLEFMRTGQNESTFLSLAATQLLLEEQSQERVLALFEESERHLKGLPIPFLLPTAMRVLTLLSINHFEEARRVAKEYNQCGPGGDALVWLCKVRAGLLNEPFTIGDEVRGVELFVAVSCLHWAGFTQQAQTHSSQLGPLSELASVNGFDWLSGQMSNLQATIAGAEAQGWSALLRPMAPWSRAMSALERISSQALSDERLIWLLDDARLNIEIEAKVQKRTKRGSWSAGRVVPVRKLLSSGNSFLTEADRVVCGRVAAYSWERGYEVVKLQFLAGHPRVFWRSDRHTPVEIQVSRPEVRLREGSDSLHLSLSTEFHPDSEETVIRETPHRLKVVIWDQQHLELAVALGPQGTELPREQWPSLAKLLPTLTQIISLDSDIAVDPESSSSDGRIWLELAPWGEGLHLEVFVKPLGVDGPTFRPGKGGKIVMGEAGQTERDLAKEEELYQQVCHLAGDSFSAQLPETLESLRALREFNELDEENFVVAWPKGQSLRLRGGLSSSAGLSLSAQTDRDWLRLMGDFRVDEDLVLSFQDLLEATAQAEGEFIPLGNGEFFQLTEDFRKRVELLTRMGVTTKKDVKMSPLAAALALEGEDVAGDDEWLDLTRRLAHADDYTPPEVPGGLTAQLRDYQAKGFQWLSRLAHWRLGACLADDMGLGKTVQALALILDRAPSGPTLVVAPTSVCGNWMEEVRRFAPELRIKEFNATGRGEMLKGMGPGDLLIISYGLLVREAEGLAEVNWGIAILDEAQAIKNPRTHRAKAAFALKAEFRLTLTGTPVENRLGELWSISRFINPTLLGPLKQFQSRLATPIEKFQEPHAQNTLNTLMAPFLLRRTKSQVLTELPPRTEVTLKVELSEKELAHYESLRRYAVERLKKTGETNAVTILAELTKLRQAACHPRLVDPQTKLGSAKLETFEGLVHDLRDSGHRALVFSQFVGHLTLVREHLEKLQIPYLYLDGSTPASRRQSLVANFQAGVGDLFLISLKAGGTGLNLTGADYVIHLDPWWNPAVEDQASDRAHRIGQTRPVTVYRLLSQNTIEEQIAELHQDKRELADSVLANGGGAPLNARELMKLLTAGARVASLV